MVNGLLLDGTKEVVYGPRPYSILPKWLTTCNHFTKRCKAQKSMAHALVANSPSPRKNVHRPGSTWSTARLYMIHG